MCARPSRRAGAAVRRSSSADVADSGNSSGAGVGRPVAGVMRRRGARAPARGRRARWFPTARTTTPRRAAAWPPLVGHGVSRLRHKQFRVDLGHIIGQPGEVQILRDHAVLQRQDRLHQPQRPGGRLGVAEVGLHRCRARRARRRRRPRPGWRIRWDHPPGCRGRGPRPCRRCGRPHRRRPTPPDTPRSGHAADGVAMLTVRPS